MFNDILLTTVDNPFNPFLQNDEWRAWDRDNGYNTPGLIARYAIPSFELDDGAASLAMLDVVRSDLTDKWVIVTRETFDLLINID